MSKIALNFTKLKLPKIIPPYTKILAKSLQQLQFEYESNKTMFVKFQLQMIDKQFSRILVVQDYYKKIFSLKIYSTVNMVGGQSILDSFKPSSIGVLAGLQGSIKNFLSKNSIYLV